MPSVVRLRIGGGGRRRWTQGEGRRAKGSAENREPPAVTVDYLELRSLGDGASASGCVVAGQDIYRPTLLVSADGTLSDQKQELLKKTDPNCIIE